MVQVSGVHLRKSETLRQAHVLQVCPPAAVSLGDVPKATVYTDTNARKCLYVHAGSPATHDAPQILGIAVLEVPKLVQEFLHQQKKWEFPLASSI